MAWHTTLAYGLGTLLYLTLESVQNILSEWVAKVYSQGWCHPKSRFSLSLHNNNPWYHLLAIMLCYCVVRLCFLSLALTEVIICPIPLSDCHALTIVLSCCQV